MSSTPRLVDVLAWATAHVDALRDRFNGREGWHLLRAEMIRDAIKQISEGEPMEQQTKNYLDLLGRLVRDRVTGFQGIVESVSWDLYGCIQAVVRPPIDDKGAMPDGKWCDVLRLVVLPGDRVMEIPGGFSTYGAGPSTTIAPNGPAEKPAR